MTGQGLTSEQLEIQKWVHEFAVREMRPVAAEHDLTEEFPWEVIRTAAKAGIYGSEFLLQMFTDPSGLLPAIVSEELTWGCAGIALAIQGTGLPVAAIFGQGTPDQIAEWLPACFGTVEAPSVAAFCATEANAGSDVAGYATHARRDGTDFVITGEKVFITNGGIADVHVVVATLDSALGTRGHASFIVPKGTPGLSMGRKVHKMGIRASHTATVNFDEVRVPEELLLGGVEKLDARLSRAREGGHSGRSNSAMKTFEMTRPVVGAQALGVARAAFEFALQYAKERHAFGKPLIEHEGIAFKLADMGTQITAARALIYHALRMSRESDGAFSMAEGSMAKLFASEVAVRVTEEAIQICGGAGYTTEFPVEKWHRDAKIYTIFEGTSEIQRMVISKALAAL